MPDPVRPAAGGGGARARAGAAVPPALQAAEPASGARPLLLRVETRAGRGNDRPAWMQLEDYADRWALLAGHLGLRGHAP
jgi:hypothetical protein